MRLTATGQDTSRPDKLAAMRWIGGAFRIAKTVEKRLGNMQGCKGLVAAPVAKKHRRSFKLRKQKNIAFLAEFALYMRA
jgi:hypothetical protein